MNKKGGYAILNLTSSTIYADAEKLLTLDKPVLVYVGNTTPFFVSGLTIDADDNIIVGGLFSISDANVVTPIVQPEYQLKLTRGSNIQISDENVISATDTIYTLPTASADTLGGVKIGSGLTITDGVLSASVETPHLYRHEITFTGQNLNDDDIRIFIVAYTNNNTILNTNALLSLHLGGQNFIPTITYDNPIIYNNQHTDIYLIAINTNNTIGAMFGANDYPDSDVYLEDLFENETYTINDRVIQIL